MNYSIAVDELRQLGISALTVAGAPEKHAETQTDILIEAELRGHASHGMLRLPRLIERIVNGIVDPAAQGEMIWQAGAFLDVDGQKGLGPVIAKSALGQLYERVETTGIACAAIGNSNHLGMLAWYVEEIAEKGLIGIIVTTSEALVHPYGGRQALLGTNPIAIGVPASPAPFVLDMATSLVSMGKIHDYANRGAPLLEGWAVDAKGDPTTDANAAKLGALTPFGDGKGYALGLAFQVLVASLTASAIGTEVKGTLDSTAVCNKGDVIILLKPRMGVGQSISIYLETIRQSPPTDPAHPVVVPGDRARSAREKRVANGIVLAPAVLEQIKAYAKTRN